MRIPLGNRTLVALGMVATITMSVASSGATDYSQFKSRMQAQFAEEQPRLSLTADKRKEFEAIITTSIDRRVAILKKHGVKPEGKNPPTVVQPALPEIQSANVDLRADLAKVLSEDQLKIFDAISDKIRKQLLAELVGG